MYKAKNSTTFVFAFSTSKYITPVMKIMKTISFATIELNTNLIKRSGFLCPNTISAKNTNTDTPNTKKVMIQKKVGSTRPKTIISPLMTAVAMTCQTTRRMISLFIRLDCPSVFHDIAYKKLLLLLSIRII